MKYDKEVKEEINFCLYKKKPVIHSFYPLKTKIKLLLGKLSVLGNYNNKKINLFLPSLYEASGKNQEIFLTNFIYTFTHENLHSIIKKNLNNSLPSKGEEEIINKILN